MSETVLDEAKIGNGVIKTNLESGRSPKLWVQTDGFGSSGITAALTSIIIFFPCIRSSELDIAGTATAIKLADLISPSTRRLL